MNLFYLGSLPYQNLLSPVQELHIYNKSLFQTKPKEFKKKTAPFTNCAKEDWVIDRF